MAELFRLGAFLKMRISSLRKGKEIDFFIRGGNIKQDIHIMANAISPEIFQCFKGSNSKINI